MLFSQTFFFDVLVAVVSGVVAVYGLVRPKVGAAMTGIGIVVSLMPPLVATGIGLFYQTNDLALRAGNIFILNVGGILVGSMLAFFMFDMRQEYKKLKLSWK